MPALPHAGGAVLRGDGLEGRRDGALEVEAELVDQVVQALSAEHGLHLAEDGLDGVQLRAVPDVVDLRDVEARILWLDVPALVHPKIVHEECYGPPNQLGPQLPQKRYEVFRGDRLWVDEAEADAALGRHRGDHRPVARVHLLLIDAEVAVPGGPLPARQAQLREVDLVEEDDGAAFRFRSLKLSQQLAALFRVLRLQSRG